MVKVEILVGVVGSKRKFVAGQISEFCLYLRVDGRDSLEVTSFMPYQQILSYFEESFRDYAVSLQKQICYFVNYNYCRSFDPSDCEFIVRNGWRNRFDTGEDVRCQPLPLEIINTFRDELTSLGLKEAKK